MAVSLNPQQVLAQQAQMQALGAQQGAQQQLMRQQNIGRIGAGLTDVANYYDRSQILKSLAPPPEQPPMPDRLAQLGIKDPSHVQLVEQAAAMVQRANPMDIPVIVSDFAQRATEMGMNPEAMQQIQQAAFLNPQQAAQAITSTAQLMENPNFRRLMARSPAQAQQLASMVVQGQPDTGLQDEVRKELRADMRPKVKQIEAMVTDLESNANKVDSLLSRVEKEGNRPAVVQALTAIVKLSDATRRIGDKEIETALNNNDWGGILIGQLDNPRFKEIFSEVATNLDPNNPKNVPVNDLRRVANDLLLAQASPMFTDYDSYLDMAAENLTKEESRSILIQERKKE
jgi:hypothetical protein